MPATFVDVHFLTSKPDKSLRPETLPFRHFAEFAETLSDLVDAMADVAIDNNEELAKEVKQAEESGRRQGVLLANFKEIHNDGAHYHLRIDARVAQPVVPVVMDGLRRGDVTGMDPNLARAIVRWQDVAARHKCDVGITHEARTEKLSQTAPLKYAKTSFTYFTQMRATMIRTGGIDARVRFRLMNGKAYTSRVSRELAESVVPYHDYILSGEAEADGDTLQVIGFKVQSVEELAEGDLATALKKLADMAIPEFITMSPAEFFARD